MSRAPVAPALVAERASGRAWLMAAMGGLGVFAALGLGRFGYSAVLPTMQGQLGLSNTQAGALASWNLAAYVAVATVAGAVAARYGTRLVVFLGVVVTALAMLATGFVDGFVSASVARVFTGAGAGLVNVPAVALMAVWFGARRRGLATGLVISGSSLALVLAGPTVPWILATWGQDAWRLVWVVFAAAGLLTAVAVALVLRDRPADVPPPPKAGGGGAGFGQVVKTRVAWWLGFVALAWGFSYVIYITFFVKRLTGEVGLSAQTAGTLFMVLGWASLSCGVLWGHISDVYGRKYALAAVCGLQAVSYVAFAVWDSLPGLIVSTLLFGITAWSVPGILGAACGDAFGARLAGASLGFVTLFLGVGQALGPLVGGALADAFGGFVPAFLLAAGVAVAGSAGALLMPVARAEAHYARVTTGPRRAAPPEG